MTPRTVTIGKYRALQRASTPEGLFNILAIDHQDSLRRVMNPVDPASLTVEQLVEFKTQVVSALAPEASGVLLDPVLGAAQAIHARYLDRAGLLVELEKGDYQLAPFPQNVQILPAWSVEKIKRMGADGVKMFFYYNPGMAELTAAQDDLIARVVADCARYDIPFYAEPILLPGDADTDRFANNFTDYALDTAKRIAALDVDVLKLEFPVNIRNQPDQKVWREACEALTEAINVPWVLLSAGVDFETYCRQVEIACATGASGYIAGRAVWGDAATIADSAQRIAWLNDTGRKRLRMLADAAQRGRQWTELIECEPVSTEWYKTY
jgi:tagatose 1,6-diphosphate aldolase